MQNEDENRPSGNTENEIAWDSRETVKTHGGAMLTLFEVLTPDLIDFQRYATLCSGKRKNDSFRLKILVWYLEPLRPSF